ncbi:MAG TPA: PQQ-dependent sugar dehydrogenase [Thermoleophilaceae bacterium]|nr:PQQ-dependent sugar dehydrogenase [Thermoleophilaceae bacterium]
MVLGLAAACFGAFGASSAAAALRVAPVGEFRQPVHVAGAASQPRSAFVLERSGRVWRLRPGGRRTLFLDARPYVRLRAPGRQRDFQGGAFALAFPPRWRAGGPVYLLYTRRDGRVHVDRFRHGRPQTILSLRQTAPVDVAGDIAFGPGGFLYASFGFGGDPEASQDPGTLAGKVVRVDPRARDPRPELVASGLRVPWRISVDGRRRRLIVADVGQSSFEEVNLVPLDAAGPLNFGWPFFEGRERRMPGGPEDATPPALAIRHSARMCAIVGGGLRRGRYVYGDVCSGRIRSVRLGARRARDDRSEHATVPYLVSFGRDGGGRLYAASLIGRVYRLR